MRRHLRFLRVVLDPIVLAVGVVVHLATRRTPRAAAFSLRRLYVRTDGRFNDAGARVSRLLHPPIERTSVSGVLGELTAGDAGQIAHAIARDGYFVFDAKLDPAACDRITEFSLRTPAAPYPPPPDGPRLALYDPAQPLAARYEFPEQSVFEHPDLQELATDETLMAVAQAYLGSRPVNDLVALWWSPPTGSAPSAEAAQLFHFDMDRVKFLKFFVYLTDVESGHGPHVYVARSHVRKPKALRRDGRIPDDEILRHYGQDAVVEITGARGTVLAVDTRGFHKGKSPESGDRLLFQVEYANSLFGAGYERIVVDDRWSPRALARIANDRWVFQRFQLRASELAA